jgi:hypothetical protein
MLRGFGYLFLFAAVGVWVLPLVGLTIKDIGDLQGRDKLYASLVIGGAGLLLLLIDFRIRARRKGQ